MVSNLSILIYQKPISVENILFASSFIIKNFVYALYNPRRFVLTQNFFCCVCLGLGLSTLVHQGLHLLNK